MTLEDNRAHLEAATDAKGNPLCVTQVPLPRIAQLDLDGHRLATNYLDYYVVNGAVIVPSYDDANDDVAAGILASTFPDRQLVQVPARVLAMGW